MAPQCESSLQDCKVSLSADHFAQDDGKGADSTEKVKLSSLRRRLLVPKLQDPAVLASGKLLYVSAHAFMNSVMRRRKARKKMRGKKR